ncbi:MAG TPA: dihydrodipicolinate synthase family protein [Acidimicrobiia bacterium]
MTGRLELPVGDGTLITWAPSREPLAPPPRAAVSSRKAFAATHVVADPRRDPGFDGTPSLDWEATLAFRRHIWSLGLGVAEAMDTAQRGGGLDWHTSQELIRRTAAEAASVGGQAVYGAGTDQLAPGLEAPLPQIVEAYREQVHFVESLGGSAVLMASRHLARSARSADDYLRVYGTVIAEAGGPVLIHWLGEMFDPELAGYWGGTDPWKAMETLLSLVQQHHSRIDGIKVSLLDEELEREMRGRLPAHVRLYTGDDLNFVDLILGDGNRHSDALLGVFDPIATAASAALQALDEGDVPRYRQILEPTVPLSRHLFAPPTLHYKTGVVFLAYLNAHQDHFRMVAGAESARSLPHLSRLLVLADQAGILRDPELAVDRMRLVLALSGMG